MPMGKKIPIEIRDGVAGKVCTGTFCGGVWKPLDQFYPKRKTGAYISRCIECELGYRHQRYGIKPKLKPIPIEIRDGVAGKVCTGTFCGGIWKPLDQFHTTGKKGRKRQCIECERAAYRLKYGATKHKIQIEIREGVAGKVCTGAACGGIWQPLDKFYPGKGAGGKLPRCKVCVSDLRYQRFHPDAPKSPLEKRDEVVGKVCMGTVCGGIWQPLDQFPIGRHIGGKGPRCFVCQAEMKSQKRIRKAPTTKVRRGTTEIRDGIEGKVCTGTFCGGIWKPLDQFHKTPTNGRKRLCIECEQAAYRLKNKATKRLRVIIEVRDGVEGKICTGRACGGIWQPLDQFYAGNGVGGKLPRCKTCMADFRYRHNNPNVGKSPLEIHDGVVGKVCAGTVCGGIWKPLDEFPKARHIGGRGPQCFVCQAEHRHQKSTKKTRATRSRSVKIEIRDGVEGKVCTGAFCGGVWKPLDEFYLSQFRGKTKYSSRCKFCLKQESKKKHPALGKQVQIEIRDGVEGKRCSGPLCNREIWHPLTDFAKGSGAGGKRAICGDCKNAIERQRRQRKKASLSGS